MYLSHYLNHSSKYFYVFYFIGITTTNVSIIGQHMNSGFECGDFEDNRSYDISSSVSKIQNKEHTRHKHTKG